MKRHCSPTADGALRPDSSSQREREQRSGAIFVEFALILPVFLLFLLAIMEFASLFFVRTLMLNTARDAARAYSIRTFDASQAEQFSLQRLSTFGLSFTATASPQSQSDPNRWVEIRTASGPATLGDPLGLFGGQDLVVRVTMRQEE